jgi:nucleoside-diphosphate-sugar epimerase
MKILLTGASGFVGKSALAEAKRRNVSIVPVFRSLESANIFNFTSANCAVIPSLLADTNWQGALSGVDVVIHCAARVHALDDAELDTLATLRSVNLEGTLNLARQAALAGVKRFIFLSSIKVNGESTQPGRPFRANNVAAPEDAYGVSKAEAEAGLRRLSFETGMEVVIIRPPLVYGPGAKGNFSKLLRWIARGVPLPLYSVTTNRRSLVGLDNLIDLILTCVDHPKAANQTLLVSDGEDLSTADLLHRIGKSLNRPMRLIPVPVSILRIASLLLGKSSIAQRLLGSLQVDISKTCTLLNWKPPVSVDEGLRRAAQEKS